MDVSKLLKVVALHDSNEVIWWNTSLEFFVGCNDIFAWACADAEPIETDLDIDALDSALKESEENGAMLYCARRRQMRPQGAIYKHLDQRDIDLLNACGPERKIDIGNPQDQAGNYRYAKANT